MMRNLPLTKYLYYLATVSKSDFSSTAFESRLGLNFGFPPTIGQGKLFYAFTRFMFSDKPRCALLIKGYAGTGKTTAVSAMVKTLDEWSINSVLLAPTGRAAKVLSGYSGKSAWTIHKQIYNKRADKSGASWFELRANEFENTVFFVDEASMIGQDKQYTGGEQGFGDLLDDLMSFVYNGIGCKLVLIGDSAQLPPVGKDNSPALQLDFLQSEYFLQIAQIELTEVIRQAEGSGILDNATALRVKILTGEAEYPQVKVQGYNDLHWVQTDMQDLMEEAYREYGKDGTIIITRSNKRANLFNQQVRARILWHEEEINSSDRMMVLKNNYFWLEEKTNSPAGFIANGDIIIIQRVRGFEDRENFRFCRAVITLADYPDIPEMEVLLLCNSIWEEGASIGFEKMRELANIIARDYADITAPGKLKRAVYSDPYFNALQVKFAYAITCHKSQGGQWPCVFVDQGYLTDEMLGVELNRWFYTAFTRAQKELYLVGFDEKIIVG
jgi:exodeoxyribonuclease V